MFKPLHKTHPLFKIINGPWIDMPIPSNISVMWNFGSWLGECLIIQILTGLFLPMHYTTNIENSFSSTIHICCDMNYGGLLCTVHANSAFIYYM